MQPYLMHAQDLRVELGHTLIVRDVTLGIRDREILTIIGPNGSGKSTLVRGMCRLLKPSGGRVLLEGRDLQELKRTQIARRIAVLPQKKSIPADITVERLVQYGRVPYARFGGRLTREDNAVVDRMLALTGTERFRFRSVATLSGGEALMAWIAMALAQQPDILFLDEPTTFLDISYQLAVLSLVRQLQAEARISVVMVLHDLNQAALNSDRLAILQAGRLKAVGTPEELCRPEMFRDIFRVETERVSFDRGKNYYIPLKMTPEER